MNVTKVDQNVAYVANISEVRCKRLFLTFHDVIYVSHICYECVIRMLCMFCKSVFRCFLQVFQTHVSSVSSIFFCMLQVLYLYVSKVDLDIAYVCMTSGAVRDGAWQRRAWR